MELPKRVDALVSHQLARWEKAGKRAQGDPSIAIASLPGAGGEEIGRRVGEALHYGVFGREIVDDIARRRGVATTLLHGLDERMRSSIERYVTDLFQQGRFHEREYFEEVARAVTALGRRGKAVIVGRGAAFLLTPETTLRVLVIAPIAYRVARIAEERGFTPERARSFVRDEDARRNHYIAHFFSTRLDDPLAYDLVVNTGVLGIELAAKTVVEVFRSHLLAGAATP